MKKVYSKPEIMFEDFSLNNAITLNCKAIVGAPSAGECPYKVESGRDVTKYIFASGMNICTSPEDDDEYNGLCYHTFIDGADSLFNS